jgi:hypothetical protein
VMPVGFVFFAVKTGLADTPLAISAMQKI